ncbi:hypothetical protein [Staphylococcus epidermidis]|uniref:hypothetical protein n=1 Tax=Staphylococcus epidermidis TaxID=1282 RepID=UPI0034D7202E
MKHVFKVFLASMLATLLGCTVVTSHHASAAENHPSTKQDTKLVATYKTSQVDAKTMKQFKSIAKEDPNFHIKKQQGKVIIEELFPNPKKQKSNYTANRSTDNHTRVLNFSDFIGNMDGNNTHNTSNNISTYSKHKGKVYKGPTKDGQHVKKGMHVHCNRFNGTKSDHRYWSKKHPRAYVDFYKSDCWFHASKYHCYSMNNPKGMVKCDGLNQLYHKGVKDCSSWKGKPKHKNWPKTAWYRN